MKHLQPVEGSITKQPAPTEPWQPSPSLPAQGLPRTQLPNPVEPPARGTFQNVPVAGGVQGTQQAHAVEVTTGSQVIVTGEKRQG
jgi:hypothetical protein